MVLHAVYIHIDFFNLFQKRLSVNFGLHSPDLMSQVLVYVRVSWRFNFGCVAAPSTISGYFSSTMEPGVSRLGEMAGDTLTLEKKMCASGSFRLHRHFEGISETEITKQHRKRDTQSSWSTTGSVEHQAEAAPKS